MASKPGRKGPKMSVLPYSIHKRPIMHATLWLNLTWPAVEFPVAVMFHTSNAPPTVALPACALFTLLSLLWWSAGEYPTSEMAFDRVCVMWEEGSVCWESPISQEAGPFGVSVHTAHPIHSVYCPLLCLCLSVSPPLQPACMPDRQTDAISHASPALGLYHSPQTALCLHTGCKFRLPLSL